MFSVYYGHINAFHTFITVLWLLFLSLSNFIVPGDNKHLLIVSIVFDVLIPKLKLKFPQLSNSLSVLKHIGWSINLISSETSLLQPSDLL